VLPTRCGIDIARDLYERIPPEERPDSLAGLDRLLRPAVAKAVELAEPVGANPPITAIK
jgi:hypothetical protein